MLKKGGENMGSVDGAGFGGGFALIIVLFILLIIIGASFCGGYGGAPGYGVAPGYGYGGCC
ncbi:MAG: YjcZ family sporulation protein [Nitrososphaeraceae archaeon]